MTFKAHSASRVPGILLLALFVVGWLIWHPGQAPAQEGYQIKAQHIFNLARFIEWPSSKFLRPDSPIIIGVIGSPEMENQLDEVIKQARINDRMVVVQRIGTNAELKRCHILFVGNSERDRLGSLLPEARGENILTIGENDRFLSRGGIVNFLERGSSVLFQINLAAARRAGLKISSKLLQLRMAQVVDADGQPVALP